MGRTRRVLDWVVARVCEAAAKGCGTEEGSARNFVAYGDCICGTRVCMRVGIYRPEGVSQIGGVSDRVDVRWTTFGYAGVDGDTPSGQAMAV